jgi:hypothetical protein
MFKAVCPVQIFVGFDSNIKIKFSFKPGEQNFVRFLILGEIRERERETENKKYFSTFSIRRRKVLSQRRFSQLHLQWISQNFLRKFVKISVTLGLSILSFLILKVLFYSKYH